MSSSFGEWVVNFSQFLGSNGYPEEVIWVTPHDILYERGLIYVKVPVSDNNENEVRELFDSGASEKWGILLQAIGKTRDTSLAYAWSPGDAYEAERNLMQKGVKMSAHVHKIAAKAIRNRLRWSYFCWKLRGKQEQKHLLFPSREGLVAFVR